MKKVQIVGKVKVESEGNERQKVGEKVDRKQRG
jgi:hypothetical protein